MKKLLTLLLLCSIGLTSLFSKSAEVQLVTTIDETPLAYELDYNGNLINDKVKDFEINIEKPLTEDGVTKYFSVKATSNLKNDKAVDIDITPDFFKTKLNGSKSFNYTSTVKPVEVTDFNIKSYILTAGKHVDELVYKFHLKWEGNADLPAGEYVSNVVINYTIK